MFKSDNTIRTERIENEAYREGWHDKDNEIKSSKK